MDAALARIENTPDGQIVVLPPTITFPSALAHVEVRRSGEELILSKPRRYPTGAELARLLADRGPPIPLGERLPVDIPDRG